MYYHPQLTQTQILLQTKLTREGVRSMQNWKPYRTKAQKAEARKAAWKTDGGYWVSGAPVSFHPVK